MNDQVVFKSLGWAIIEWRIAYFTPETIDRSWGNAFVISNTLYDAAEDLYEALAAKLGETAYTTSVVGVGSNRGSIALAQGKLASKRGDFNPTLTKGQLIDILKQYKSPAVA